MDLKRSKSSQKFDFEMIITNVHVRKSSQPYFPTVDCKSIKIKVVLGIINSTVKDERW